MLWICPHNGSVIKVKNCLMFHITVAVAGSLISWISQVISACFITGTKTSVKVVFFVKKKKEEERKIYSSG